MLGIVFIEREVDFYLKYKLLIIYMINYVLELCYIIFIIGGIIFTLIYEKIDLEFK